MASAVSDDFSDGWFKLWALKQCAWILKHTKISLRTLLYIHSKSCWWVWQLYSASTAELSLYETIHVLVPYVFVSVGLKSSEDDLGFQVLHLCIFYRPGLHTVLSYSLFLHCHQKTGSAWITSLGLGHSGGGDRLVCRRHGAHFSHFIRLDALFLHFWRQPGHDTSISCCESVHERKRWSQVNNRLAPYTTEICCFADVNSCPLSARSSPAFQNWLQICQWWEEVQEKWVVYSLDSAGSIPAHAFELLCCCFPICLEEKRTCFPLLPLGIPCPSAPLPWWHDWCDRGCDSSQWYLSIIKITVIMGLFWVRNIYETWGNFPSRKQMDRPTPFL